MTQVLAPLPPQVAAGSRSQQWFMNRRGWTIASAGGQVEGVLTGEPASMPAASVKSLLLCSERSPCL